MDADKLLTFNKLRNALTDTVEDFLTRHLPLRRIALVASILKNCDIEIYNSAGLFGRLLNEQKEDGGWIDCEDTTWILSCLSNISELEENFIKGLSWLEDECSGDGWGFCARDNPNIPITSQIIYFLPFFLKLEKAMYWLEGQWQKDFSSPVSLNYKAAWYLLSYNRLQNLLSLSQELFHRTIEYLINEQRDNGSWGPWRQHPSPSDYFTTGICMASLALSNKRLDDRKIYSVLKKSIRWITRNQLENGLFPTHYIEEGSAWILFGLSKTLPLIEEDV